MADSPPPKRRRRKRPAPAAAPGADASDLEAVQEPAAGPPGAAQPSVGGPRAAAKPAKAPRAKRRRTALLSPDGAPAAAAAPAAAVAPVPAPESAAPAAPPAPGSIAAMAAMAGALTCSALLDQLLLVRMLAYQGCAGAPVTYLKNDSAGIVLSLVQLSRAVFSAHSPADTAIYQ